MRHQPNRDFCTHGFSLAGWVAWSSLGRLLALGALLVLLSGCATDFPRPADACCADSELTGNQLFARTYRAHGGDAIAALTDVNVALDGDWHFWITRIQPLVTDHRYRVQSEERLVPGQGVYAARYRGPAGTKSVLRTRDEIQVQYDGNANTDTDVLQSTALTADSFYLFTLGPLAFDPAVQSFTRLADANEGGVRYYRIHAELNPGIGMSARDEVVLWIDPKSMRTYRVHITLEGYRTTIGAHVDVTYLDYTNLSGFIFPSSFHERVRGPIAIHAHRWHYTGLDINRGWSVADLTPGAWKGRATEPARSLQSATVPTGEPIMDQRTLFAQNQEILEWRAVNDNVMGGRSAGTFTTTSEGLVFSGSLNTNGGGFASVRSNPSRLALGDYSGIRLRAKGDGRTYTLLLRERGADHSYQTTFTPEPDRWQNIELPFSSFAPYRRGTPLQLDGLRGDLVEQLGIMMNDGVDGAFELTVSHIEAY